MPELRQSLLPCIQSPGSVTKEGVLAGNRVAREDKICGLGSRTERNRDCRKGLRVGTARPNVSGQ
jgi:hypothetical protein